jgi:predicted NBD/HSP70 family sugar kinase
MKVGNAHDMRRMNRCSVIEILLRNDSISRADIVRQTGLNKATITNIINDFSHIGIVEEAGTVIASNGRRTAGIRLSMRDYVTLVIRINRYDLSFAYCNIHGEISDLMKVDITNDDDIESILDKLEKYTRRLLDNQKGRKVLGISIGILGWLFCSDGRMIAMTDAFPELSKVDFREEMQKMFPGYIVMLDHDANLSALAEWDEYIRNCDNDTGTMLSIIGGIGFGAGIIIDGKLFHGANGIAGEIGHMGINFNSVNYSPNSTSSFRGTFEEYASPRALQGLIQDRLMDFPDSCLSEKSTLYDIYQAYENKDELAVWAVNRVARLLAYGLTGLIFILNPDVIILGDKIIRSERFLQKLRSNLKDMLPSILYERLDLRLSKFDENSVLLGASIAMTKYYLETHKIIDLLD